MGEALSKYQRGIHMPKLIVEVWIAPRKQKSTA